MPDNIFVAKPNVLVWSVQHSDTQYIWGFVTESWFDVADTLQGTMIVKYFANIKIFADISEMSVWRVKHHN